MGSVLTLWPVAAKIALDSTKLEIVYFSSADSCAVSTEIREENLYWNYCSGTHASESSSSSNVPRARLSSAARHTSSSNDLLSYWQGNILANLVQPLLKIKNYRSIYSLGN